jgi:NADH-quinone oxidoreductase subunit E
MQTLSSQRLDLAEQAFLDGLIAERNGRPGALLGILEKVQEHNRHKYLPLETLEYIAHKTSTPLARVYSVATFYSLFNLQPQGDHTISICRGTLQSVRLELGMTAEISEEEKVLLTTPDRKFTVRTVACFGQCAMAPVVELDHRIRGHVNERTLHRDIETLDRESY